ncbi:hypothetical protein [Aristaeella lactis]|uniref:Uncharacterized protein n=1 Tax=Aristaeella lactis TaxID=3046383 RepID=A0AC61PNN3_9FIRM|nr:hypothetical protein [Aristaeella lactis]QUA52562.1 hypothetical protein JYE50_12770 [Aristaeella lactis]SMC77251.1 hypothetical protein SAMN06297397_2441 [Aristaeella lactis]
MKKELLVLLCIVCCALCSVCYASGCQARITGTTYECAGEFRNNWVGKATDYIFVQDSQVDITEKMKHIKDILAQCSLYSEDDINVPIEVKKVSCVQTQFGMNDDDLIKMYMNPEQYSRFWAHCRIETREDLLLLYSETDDKGLWIDRGCGQELPRYDDVEIKKDISNDVYLIIIVQNDLFDDVNQAITGAHIRFVFSDMIGNEYTYTADLSEAVRINPEEAVTFQIESIEDSETKLDENVIQYFMKSGVKDRNKKQKLTDHPDQYECRSCTITLSDENPEFYFAKPEFDSTESEIIFVDEDIFDGCSDMESNTIILYYFVPKQKKTHDTFDVWLVVEFDKYEANFNSFGFSFGPCYRVHLGEITL